MKALMISLAVLFWTAGVVWVVGLCVAAAKPLPRPPRNRRGHRLAKWLKFHGGLK